MIMKTRHILFGLASAAMMTIAGCETAEIKDVQSPEANASSFELIADITQTKTTLDPQDGYKVAWEEGDIIYMVTSDGTWGVPFKEDQTTNSIAEFTYADGKFSTEATIADGEYTFKGMYAAESQKSYHRGASSTHKLQATQTQDCADPTAHIKDNDALVGTFTATVPMSETANMNMSHLHTLMQVDVKNTTGEAIEVTKFEMTAEGADLAGVFNVEAFDIPAISTKSGASSTITVNITGGDVENNASLPVYFVMAPFADYSGDVTFKVTDSNENTYTKTVAMNGISFEAGKYNTTSYTISVADEVEPEPANVTWDLTKDETSEASEERIAWTSDFAEMYCVKDEATTNANNYYGGDANNRTSTRFYKNSILTIAPKTGYAITSVVFTATSNDYASALSSSTSTWNNAAALAESKTVTVNPTNGAQAMTATIGGTCGFTSVVVYYAVSEGGETPEPDNKTLVSIAVENPKTEYTVGDTFVEPTVKATYDDASTATVTGATFTGNDLTSEGTKTVTVSYTEGEVTATTTFDITVSKAELLVEDGTYVIAVKENGVYYAASTDANGTRRAYVELTGYSSGDYVSHDSKIVWTIANSGAGITVCAGDQYWSAVKNGISLGKTATIISVANSETEGAYLLSANCGPDGIRYLSKNAEYGFGFYAESNKEDIYLIPASFVELPNLEAPVVTAELNGDNTGIDVSWNAVENATSYVVSCTNQDDVTVTGTSCSFTELAAGTYIITVTAKAENYNSAISQPVEVIVPSSGDGPELKTFEVTSDAIVGGTKYAKYEGTVDSRSWVITWGGNNKSVGTNSSNRPSCNLSSNPEYAVGPVTTSATASAFASNTSISNVSKISYAALTGGSNHASTKIYVLYSADGKTFSQISLISGEQGATINTTNGGEFEFASCSGYFAVVFVATNQTGNWRLDDVNLTFTYSE